MGGRTKAGRQAAGRKEKAGRIGALLDRHYPHASCALRFRTPLELLVATVLSAQCTDARVNQVTEVLFRKYRTAADYAGADPEDFLEEIRPTGFFRNKGRHIIAAASQIESRFKGLVPRTLEELTSLPGIGRKTANVILGNAFGVPGIVVDTHVGRISRRLGLTPHQDPVKVEFDLMDLFPPEKWTALSHQMIAHGRQICRAQRPRCGECFFDSSLCPSRRVAP